MIVGYSDRSLTNPQRDATINISMKRLPIDGCSLVSPCLGAEEFYAALGRLQVAHAFDSGAIKELHTRLGLINGIWTLNEESKLSSAVANALLGIQTNLDAAIALLRGVQDGPQTTTTIQSIRLTSDFLARNPEVSQAPGLLISEFRRMAAQISHASSIARIELCQRADKTGRDELPWFDEFTTLLLEIAEKASVPPTFSNDRGNDGRPCGWLFNAATELELFLCRGMRSPSDSARGQRLKRSLRKRYLRQGQNPLSAA